VWQPAALCSLKPSVLQLVAAEVEDDEPTQNRPCFRSKWNVGDNADQDAEREPGDGPDDDCPTDADRLRLFGGASRQLSEARQLLLELQHRREQVSLLLHPLKNL
jgi:hypothetical protein